MDKTMVSGLLMRRAMMKSRGDTTDYKALWVARLSGTLSGEVIIPTEVTNLANNAFMYCKSITSIKTIATQVIGEAILSADTGISLIDLCADTTDIKWHAFYTTTGSITLICRATTPPSLNAQSFGSNLVSIQVPAESVDAYKAASNWSSYASIITAINE